MKTQTPINPKLLILCSILIIGLLGCRYKEKEKINQSIDQPQKGDSLCSPNLNISYLLPSPNEIINIIFKEKINYKSELGLIPNPENNIINSNFQALMLGIYISDFTYTTVYADFNKSYKYLETIIALSERTGLNVVFDKVFFKRVERNLTNIDSLVAIYNDFTENSFNLIATSGRNELLSLIAMGASIESIYLGYNVFKTKPIDKSLKPFFIKQRMIFENFYQNYENYNSHKMDLKNFNNDLDSFYSNFKLNVWLIVDKSKVSKTDSITSIDVKYIVKANSENINDLGKNICRLRENLINHSYQ